MSSTTNDPNWSERAVSTLRILWTEGHATAEIGRRMAVTKNAVVGKSHRLGLPARPSPIRRRSAVHPEPPQCSAAPPVPIAAVVALAPIEQPPAPVAQALKVVPPPPKDPALPLKPLPLCIIRVDDCQWPIGTPGAAGFRLCGAAPAPGKPYCDSHCRKAYVRVHPMVCEDRRLADQGRR